MKQNKHIGNTAQPTANASDAQELCGIAYKRPSVNRAVLSSKHLIKNSSLCVFSFKIYIAIWEFFFKLFFLISRDLYIQIFKIVKFLCIIDVGHLIKKQQTLCIA